MTKTGQMNTPQKIAAYPALICASPRKNGNSATITHSLATTFEELGQKTNVFFLHEQRVEPCIGCGLCEKTAHMPYAHTLENFEHFGCPFSSQDTSRALIHALLYAPFVCFIAPIYMYHLPAQAKALLDRLQPFWHLHTAQNSFLQHIDNRPCYTTLLAGRKKGEHLFSGVARSLRFALRPLHLELGDTLELYGLDGAKDFATNATAQQQVRALAITIMEQRKNYG